MDVPVYQLQEETVNVVQFAPHLPAFAVQTLDILVSPADTYAGRALATGYAAPAPGVTGTAPVTDYVPVAPAVTYTAPAATNTARAPASANVAPALGVTGTAPLTECITVAPAVTYTAPVTEHVAPALGVSCETPAPATGYGAFAPAVTCTVHVPACKRMAPGDVAEASAHRSDTTGSGRCRRASPLSVTPSDPVEGSDSSQ